MLTKKMCIGREFFDIAKAFGCINHEILLAKLHFCGIRGTDANWFRFYLTYRKLEMETNHLVQLQISYPIGVQ
jgi:hypothetical protein